MKPVSVFIRSLFAAASLILTVACTEKSDYARIEGFAQGGTYAVTFRVPEGTDEEQIRLEIDSILARIDNSLSGYNKGSLLSRLNAGEDLPLDSVFIRCFKRSTEVWRESEGAFDPSAAPLFDIWGFGFENGGSPTREQIAQAMQVVGMDKFSLECRPDGMHLAKADSLAKLNFNAIAQGLSCDMIAEFLESEKCHDYLIDVGREMMCSGERKGGGAWRIGIDKPVDNAGEEVNLQDIVDVSGKGIVTSGNYRKFYIKDGEKFAHTIDPRTGSPVKHTLLSATVIAKDAATADAYATWFMVAGLENASAIASQRDDIEAYLVYGDQQEMKVWKSAGFRTEEKQLTK